MWGNDAATGTSSNVSASYVARAKRIWKVAVAGAPGTITFSMDLSATGFPNTGSASDYALLKDTDTDFSSGSTTHTAGASLVGSILTFTGVSFSDGDLFTIAASNIVLPGGLSGLIFWVKGGVGVTGTTNVSNWADQSGSANNATQGTGANQPALVTNDINFNSSINFYQGSSIMSITIPPANLNATVFTVAVPTVNSDWRTMFRGASSDHPMIVESGATRLGYYDNDNAGFNFSGFTWLQNEIALVDLGLNYYRLKQTDFDGTSTLSRIVSVNITDVVQPGMKINIYPNPATQQFTIEGNGIENSEYIMTNGLGQKINVNASVQSGKIIIDTANLPRGLYLIIINGNGKTASRKIILE